MTEHERHEGQPIDATAKYLESSPSEFKEYLVGLGPNAKVSITIDMVDAPESNWLHRIMTENSGQIEFKIRATDEDYESYKETIFNITGVQREKI